MVTANFFAINARFNRRADQCTAMDHVRIYAGIVLSLIAAAVLLAGCTGTSQNTPPENIEVSITPANIGYGSSVTEANNQFGYDLYTTISNGSPGNVFFSPFSISSAFALTYEGAKGKTADEIRTVFHFPQNVSTLREDFFAIDAGLNNGNDANYTLRTANALWAEKTFAFLPSYTDAAVRYYDANTTNLDFITQPEASRQTINAWVGDKTAGKIPELIPAGAIDPATRLVITNAVYFNGTWALPFDANQTSSADFHVTSEKTVQVKMMQKTGEDARYNYAETGNLQVLELPYAHGPGHELSMIILLPKNADITAAEAALDPKNLTAIENSTTVQQVQVYIPKFKVETQYMLPTTLASMGMPTAFTGTADFSNMDGRNDLYISDVIHKAYVDVNERGTEAAAATAVVMRMNAVYNPNPVPTFRADHPFVFLIEDKDSGTVLFIGKVTDPTNS